MYRRAYISIWTAYYKRGVIAVPANYLHDIIMRWDEEEASWVNKTGSDGQVD